jgi:hypothetical protein
MNDHIETVLLNTLLIKIFLLNTYVSVFHVCSQINEQVLHDHDKYSLQTTVVCTRTQPQTINLSSSYDDMVHASMSFTFLCTLFPPPPRSLNDVTFLFSSALQMMLKIHVDTSEVRVIVISTSICISILKSNCSTFIFYFGSFSFVVLRRWARALAFSFDFFVCICLRVSHVYR